jgi:hypothetical protein
MTDSSNDLQAAIKRLTQFRASWEPGDQIDESSHLTADDFDLIIDALQQHADLEPNGSLTANYLGNMA